MEERVEYAATGTGKTQTALAHAVLAHGDLTELLAVFGRLAEVCEDPSIPCPLRYRAVKAAGEARELLRKWKPTRALEEAVTPATAKK